MSNEVVIGHMRRILSGEFVDYGYLKVTHALHQQYSLVINKKNVSRLINSAGLLHKRPSTPKSKRLWVSELVPDSQSHFSYLEFNIKYIGLPGPDETCWCLV